MLKFFIIANFFFLYVPIKSSIINKMIEYSSLWNWMPQSWQRNFFNMKKKNSIQNSILHYGIFIAPFAYTGYQIKKRIKSIYKNDSSIFELFFNYKQDKQATNIEDILIIFFKDNERKKFFFSKIIACIDEALKDENKYDNYLNYYQTYLKTFLKKIHHKLRGFLYATNKKYFLETMLFHFTWKLIQLQDRYNLDKLKTKLEEVLKKEKELKEKKIKEEKKLKEELENIYAVIQQITKYPSINFFTQENISKELKEKKKDHQIKELMKIKQNLFNLINQKDETDKIINQKLTLLDTTKDDTVLTFIKKEIPNIISLPSISKFQSLTSPWVSNIFTLGLFTLNIYPWFYFSDFKNTFNPYPNLTFNKIKFY